MLNVSAFLSTTLVGFYDVEGVVYANRLGLLSCVPGCRVVV